MNTPDDDAIVYIGSCFMSPVKRNEHDDDDSELTMMQSVLRCVYNCTTHIAASSRLAPCTTIIYVHHPKRMHFNLPTSMYSTN